MTKSKVWHVRVHRGGQSKYIGDVHASTEELARCAALSMYGHSDDDGEEVPEDAIGIDDDFDVTEA